MAMFTHTPVSEIEPRIEKLQTALAAHGIDGAVITQFVDLFYFSGTSQSGHLYVPREGEPVLMVRKSFSRAKNESPLKNIVSLGSLKKIPEMIDGIPRGGKLGFELDVIPYNTVQMYRGVFEGTDIVDISGIIKTIRNIKSPYEIDLVRIAAGVIDQVFAEVPSMLREGMTEVELASLFEAGMRRRGYSGCCRMRAFNQDFYMGNIVSGSSGAVPTYFDGPVGGTGLTPANNPHGAGWKEIGRDEIVYIDYTCVVNGYTADAARMFVIGRLPDRLVEAHQVALRIQDELASMAQPGVECGALYERACEIAGQQGFGDNFMGYNGEGVRFVGHGVGLELDEAPVLAKGVKMKLESGMTFALEPKFVFPEGAIGVENTFVVNGDSALKLNHATEDIVRL